MVKELPPQPAFASELRKYGLTLAERINSGTYGGVYEVKDAHAHKWDGPKYALKIIEPTAFGRQRLEEKGLTPSDLVNSEFLPAGQEHLIPRTIVQLGKNLQGVLMPYYSQFSDSIFGTRLSDSASRHFHSTHTPNYNLNFFADVLEGVNEFTATKKRAHGDIKLENIALSQKNLEHKYLLGDFGSSHYADWSVPGKSGTRVGDPTIRAPELFTDNANVHPTRESDAWSLGSILFAVTTGQELWQEHVNYQQPVAKVGADLESFYSMPNVVEAELEKRIEKVPNYARDLVSSLLVLNPDKRQVADASLVEKTRKLARRYHPRTNLIDTAKSYGKVILGTTVGALVFSLVSPIIYDNSILEQQKNRYFVSGENSVSHSDITEKISFEKSSLSDQSMKEALAISPDLSLRDDATATIIAPNDETYRLLWKAVRFSSLSHGGHSIFTPIVQDAEKLYYDGPNPNRHLGLYNALANRLKIALDNQRKRSKIIDVEDVMVDALWGDVRLNEAKRLRGSNYISYTNARFNEYGDKVIPDDADLAIRRTVDYINAHFAARNPKLAELIANEGF